MRGGSHLLSFEEVTIAIIMILMDGSEAPEKTSTGQ